MIDSAKVEREYHELLLGLEKSGHSQKKVQDDLMAAFKEMKVLLHGEPIPSFISPVFVGPAELKEYQRITELMMSCLEKVSDLYYTAPECAPLFELAKGEDELTAIDAGYRGRIQHARIDAFVSNGVVRICEFNCDTPGGPGWLDQMSEGMIKTPAMKALGKKYTLSYEKLMPGVLKGLLACYKDWCKRKGTKPTPKPRILVQTLFDIDPTNDEIQNIGAWLRGQGYDAVVAQPQDCTFDGTTFEVKGEPVQLMYRRGAGYWWLDHAKEYDATKRAYAAGAICMVNPISSKLGGKKSLMAVLQSAKMQPHLTEEERDAVSTHIPWTRLVERTKTDYQGERVDLVPFLTAKREDMVLKPIGLFGGKDVVLGRDVDAKTWGATIKRALEERYVVQEYIPIPTVSLPLADDKGLRFVTKKINLNFYAFNGAYAGGLARVSDTNIINVCAGGGIVPVITVAPKKGK